LTLLLSLAVALTLYIGGRRAIAGMMSLGMLVAATSYLAQLAQPLRRLSWLTGMVSLCQAGAERLFEILDVVPDIQEAPQARPLPHLEGWVQFEHVSFRYSAGASVLHDVTFSAAPGQVIALLEFQTAVEEIFDVQLLPGLRFPEVIGFQQETIQHTFVVPPVRPDP
jgi:ABC-type multidrug transport system fused ATPase/permease subunit